MATMQGNYEGNNGLRGRLRWTVWSEPADFSRASMVKPGLDAGERADHSSTRVINCILEGNYGRNGNYGRQDGPRALY